MIKYILVAMLALSSAVYAQEITPDTVDKPFTVGQFRAEYAAIDDAGRTFMRGYVLAVVDFLQAANVICPRISDLAPIAQGWFARIMRDDSIKSALMSDASIVIVKELSPSCDGAKKLPNNPKDRNIL